MHATSCPYYVMTSGSEAEEPLPASDGSRSGPSPHLLSGRCALHRCRTQGSSPASRRRRRNRCTGWWCSRPTGFVEWWGWMLPPWGNHPPAPSWLPPPWIAGETGYLSGVSFPPNPKLKCSYSQQFKIKVLNSAEHQGWWACTSILFRQKLLKKIHFLPLRILNTD